MPFNPNEPFQTVEDIGFDPEAKFNSFDPSALGAVGRGGAQGLTLGFADEAAAGSRALYEYLANKFGGGEDARGLGDIYGEEVEESRMKDALTREAYPKTMMASEVAGAVAPVIASTLATAPAGGAGGAAAAGGTAARMGALGTRMLAPTSVKGLAALGGVAGAGYSEAEDMAGLGKDVLKGGAMGVVVPKAIQGLGRGALGLGKGLMKGATGVSKEAMETYMAKPEMVKGSFEGISEKMGRRIDLLDDAIQKGSAEARGTLSGLRGATSIDDVVGKIENMKNSLKVGGGDLSGMAQNFEFGPTTKNTLKVLTEMQDDIKRLKPVDDWKSGVKSYVSERDVKQIMDRLDDEINWKDLDKKQSNEMLYGLRRYLDDILKEGNPEYAQKIAPVAEKIRTRDDFLKKFGYEYNPFGAEKSGAYLPKDAAPGKFKRVIDKPMPSTRRALKRFTEQTGGDIMPELKGAAAAEEFKGGTPGYFGKMFDKGEGGQMAKGMLDTMRKFQLHKLPSLLSGSPEIFGPYAKILQNASRRGSHALATTHFILQQQDRDYSKLWEEVSKEQREPESASQPY